MKICIVYSSVTGNTRKLAQALSGASDVPLFSVTEAPAPEEWDLLGLGFWVRKGLPDPRLLRYIARVQNRRVFFFGTLGAWPNSPHALRCVRDTQALLEAGGNQVLGHFLCQGKVDPRVVTRGQARGGHRLTEERIARLDEAKRHPDAADLARGVKLWRHSVSPHPVH